MAYTTTTTRALGYTVTAADWNVYANNFTALRADTCGVYRSAVQTIPDTTLTAMLWDTEKWDYTAMHSTGANTDRINILRTGIYLVTSTLRFAANATGVRSCYVYRSDAAALWGEQCAGHATIDAFFSPSFVTHLSVGDYVTVKVSQTSGGNLDIQRDGERIPFFSVTLLFDLTA